MAIELRHRSWSDDANTAKLLAEGNTCWVLIDKPGFEYSIARQLPLTSDTAYFRFHRRNAENWWCGDNETHYKYLYSTEEIEELAQRVADARKKSKLTFAFFNNHWQGYAPQNAINMIKALELLVNKSPIQGAFQDENMAEGR